MAGLIISPYGYLEQGYYKDDTGYFIKNVTPFQKKITLNKQKSYQRLIKTYFPLIIIL